MVKFFQNIWNSQANAKLAKRQAEFIQENKQFVQTCAVITLIAICIIAYASYRTIKGINI